MDNLDRHDDDWEVELALDAVDGADAPPDVPEADGPDPGPQAPDSKTFKNSHLLTFVLALFCALELQAILVLLGTADAGMAETMTWAFGGIFMLSVFGWFIGGMLWFAKKFDQHR